MLMNIYKYKDTCRIKPQGDNLLRELRRPIKLKLPRRQKKSLMDLSLVRLYQMPLACSFAPKALNIYLCSIKKLV